MAGDPLLRGIEIARRRRRACRGHYEPALAVAREHRLAPPEAVSAYSLGAAAWVAGDVAEAERRFAESFASVRRSRDSDESVPALVNVAEMVRAGSRRARPAARLRGDAAAVRGDLVPRSAAGYVLLNWANVARSAGDDGRARALLAEALAHFERIGSDQGRADVWARLANLELAEGRRRRGGGALRARAAIAGAAAATGAAPRSRWSGSADGARRGAGLPSAPRRC